MYSFGKTCATEWLRMSFCIVDRNFLVEPKKQLGFVQVLVAIVWRGYDEVMG